MGLFTLTRADPGAGLDDLSIVSNGLSAPRGQDAVEYFWYELQEHENSRTHETFRVVRLIELRFLPQETRHDAGLVAKTRAAITGLYASSARFDLLQVVAGVFDPPLGIVQ